MIERLFRNIMRCFYKPFPYYFFLFSILFVLLMGCPQRPFVIPNGDPILSYSPIIESGNFCDWHSVLFLYECHQIYRIINKFFQISGYEVLLILWYIFATIAFFSIRNIWNHLYKINPLNVKYGIIFGIILISLSQCLVQYTTLDFYFTSSMFFLVSLLVSVKKSTNIIFKITCYLIIFVILLHFPDLRKNAVLLIPFFLCYFTLPWNKKNIVVKIVTAIILSGGIVILSHSIKEIIPHKKTYPASVMLISDLKIASAFRGEYEAEAQYMKENFSVDYFKADGSSYFPLFRLHKEGDLYLPAGLSIALSDQEWKQLLNRYMFFWRNEPKSMIFSKIHTVISFYIGNDLTYIFYRFYAYYFPNLEPLLKLEPKSLKDYYKSAYYTPARIFRLFIYLVSFVVICYALTILKSGNQQKNSLKYSVVFIAIGLIYNMSFLVITPTGDNRYHTPSVLFIILGLEVFFSWLSYKSCSNNSSLKVELPSPQSSSN